MKREKKPNLFKEKILVNILMTFRKKKKCGGQLIKESFSELLMVMRNSNINSD
jgi:hypothetical protein